MESLSRGKLKETVLKGERPESITVQVLNVKVIKNSDDKKFRVALWDGIDEYIFGVYMKHQPHDAAPSTYSIIRVADDEKPHGLDIPLPFIRPVPNKAEPTYAFGFSHYTLVKDGSQVGKKIPSDIRTFFNPHQNKSASSSENTPPLQVTPSRASSTSSPAAVKPKAATNGSGSSHTPTSKPPGVSSNARSAVKRNLEESYSNGASAAKQAKPEVGLGGATHQIAALNPYQNKYKIKAKVTQLKDIRQIQTSKFQGQVVDCILTDSSGDIKLCAWNDEASKLVGALQNNKAYHISGCRIQAVKDSRYNKTSHNYELQWSANTKVDGPLKADAILTNYNFIPLSSIPVMAADAEVDVAGWVKETGELVEFTSKNGKDLKKRLLTLVDDSDGGTCIDLTLWADDAVQFKSPGRVLAIKAARIGEWNGGKNLSIGFNSSYEVEPAGVRGVDDLVKWAAKLDPNSQAAVSKISSSQTKSNLDTPPYKMLKEIKEEMVGSSESRRYSVAGYIISIKVEGVTYRAHEPSDGTRCMKKVIEGEEPDTFKCVKCNKNSLHDSETTHRYTMQLCIADATGVQWCVAFDAAVRLVGKSASELADIAKDDYNEFEELVVKSQFKQFIFVVSAKIDNFREQNKLKLTIHEAKDVMWEDCGKAGVKVGEEGVAWKEHVERLVKDVGEMEEQIGESHEELYGVTWNDSLTD